MECNELWVVIETRDAAPTRLSSQLLAGAFALAAEKKLSAAAVVLGGSAEESRAFCRHAPVVLHLSSERLQPYESTRSAFALEKLVAGRGVPAAILFPASALGLELAPRMAARLKVGYLAACSAVWWEGDRLAARRAVLGGRAYQEAALLQRPAVLSVRAGAFANCSPFDGQGELLAMEIDVPARLGAEILGCRRTACGKQDVSEASRIVAGGRGAQECFGLIEELAELIGGAAAASRAVVDAGLRPLDEQVGKSGKTVSPDLYIACGISGAVHHVLGMNTSRVVAAINSDPGAAIFQHADFGLVGEAQKVLAELIKMLREQAGK